MSARYLTVIFTLSTLLYAEVAMLNCYDCTGMERCHDPYTPLQSDLLTCGQRRRGNSANESNSRSRLIQVDDLIAIGDDNIIGGETMRTLSGDPGCIKFKIVDVSDNSEIGTWRFCAKQSVEGMLTCPFLKLSRDNHKLQVSYCSMCFTDGCNGEFVNTTGTGAAPAPAPPPLRALHAVTLGAVLSVTALY